MPPASIQIIGDPNRHMARRGGPHGETGRIRWPSAVWVVAAVPGEDSGLDQRHGRIAASNPACDWNGSCWRPWSHFTALRRPWYRSSPEQAVSVTTRARAALQRTIGLSRGLYCLHDALRRGSDRHRLFGSCAQVHAKIWLLSRRGRRALVAFDRETPQFSARSRCKPPRGPDNQS